LEPRGSFRRKSERKHILLAQDTIHADVVALDQVIMVNRLGTVRPEGMIYALLGDIRPIKGYDLEPGNVQLRAGKRPRPLVLRVHEGDCLEIAFQNFLSKDPQPVAPGVTSLQDVTRNASVHVAGMQLVKGITDDGTYVGANPKVKENFSGVVPPGGSATYAICRRAGLVSDVQHAR
jgi:hypothetical protein